MIKLIKVTAVLLAFGLAVPQSANAFGPAGFAGAIGKSNPVGKSNSRAFINTKGTTLAPFAFVKYCVNNPRDCSKGSEREISITSARMRQLSRVNASVNRSMKAVNDRNGQDVWQAGAKSGDCEDFALTKRRKLVQLGWPSSLMRMAVVRTRSGEGHAVLVVKTQKGDLVLDNRFNSIRNWRKTDLRWVKIQSGDNPRIWYNL